ncbi:Potassium voltage-gated channel protein Shal [Habropoda laboriosa]|uniref:Potassium voltage-gated channel protein Shal n=1 Tax=Habropoda laboriosa TaxID=597456 RepID=A0A0L7RBT2_9HYME|nr:Potassium voltage-gated channel protein Shal [Habropoda laboriosa]
MQENAIRLLNLHYQTNYQAAISVKISARSRAARQVARRAAVRPALPAALPEGNGGRPCPKQAFLGVLARRQEEGKEGEEEGEELDIYSYLLKCPSMQENAIRLLNLHYQTNYQAAISVKISARSRAARQVARRAADREFVEMEVPYNGAPKRPGSPSPLTSPAHSTASRGGLLHACFVRCCPQRYQVRGRRILASTTSISEGPPSSSSHFHQSQPSGQPVQSHYQPVDPTTVPNVAFNVPGDSDRQRRQGTSSSSPYIETRVFDESIDLDRESDRSSRTWDFLFWFEVRREKNPYHREGLLINLEATRGTLYQQKTETCRTLNESLKSLSYQLTSNESKDRVVLVYGDRIQVRKKDLKKRGSHTAVDMQALQPLPVPTTTTTNTAPAMTTSGGQPPLPVSETA